MAWNSQISTDVLEASGYHPPGPVTDVTAAEQEAQHWIQARTEQLSSERLKNQIPRRDWSLMVGSETEPKSYPD